MFAYESNTFLKVYSFKLYITIINVKCKQKVEKSFFNIFLILAQWAGWVEKLYLADKVDLGDVQANFQDRKYIEKWILILNFLTVIKNIHSICPRSSYSIYIVTLTTQDG